jgi:type I restriction enzyme R subunit
MNTDVSEKGFESLIVANLTGEAAAGAGKEHALRETRTTYGPPAGYILGDAGDYDRDHAVDWVQLFAFLQATQPKVVETLNVGVAGPARQQFLSRLQGEIAKRGVIDVLRKGVRHGPAAVDLYYGTPTPGNATAAERYALNRFSVTRQLRYSKDETRLALDLGVFINGLPLATFELKNNITKQTVEDAVRQYQRDRDPRELLFQFGRCAVHFAVDDHEVRMCTELKGQASWFLPFNKGFQDGAGNPPNPDGLATDYLWKEVLQRDSLANIIENYAQIVEEADEHGRKRRKQVFPRYHQLDVVRKLLADASACGVGRRYLIEHSAGSGKSNSITWLAHQLVELKAGDQPVFDSIIVVTDRRVLDKQIRDNIRRFAQESAVVGAALRSGDLRVFLQAGKKIIISTVQKFPFILDEIGDEHRDRHFAILIDEAHSSQGGRTMAQMNMALAEQSQGEEETTEDAILRIMQTRKLLPNASYFAFTATPKNKTLEMFGQPQPDGTFRPFHSYTMKQAIQEGFILDVLQLYTPVQSYYRLVKKVEGDPEFDVRRAQKKLRRYVETHDYAIRTKAEIMIDHFHDEVLARQKIGGQARAMVVTGSIAQAIQYKQAFDAYLLERKSPYQAIVAFSGEHEVGGRKMDEAAMNGFPSVKIPEKFREDPYRFLIVAEKFQTGFDEPLLHTMYVDKVLAGIQAVQTLSRLNRAHPQKHDTFILDFVNDADMIQAAFEPYYRTTILSIATDPNKLHDLKAELDGYQVYAWPDVEALVALYLGGADRDKLDPILDSCVATYKLDLNEDGQVEFKSKAKTFVRTYSFLAAVLPYTIAEWEKLSIFLSFLTPKLPAPREDDFSKGILETVDMDSYRAEKQAQMAIALPDQEGEVGPVPTSAAGHKPETELDLLSNIIRTFNELFGNIDWKDSDKISRVIAEEIPAKVAADQAYQNAMRNSDKQNARIEHDKALERVLIDMLSDHTELFKLYSDNPDFHRWLSDMVFQTTFKPPESPDMRSHPGI